MPKNMPVATSFKQQKLRACTPILTPFPVITTFFLIGIIFIPIGAILLAQSNDVVEVSVRYDDQCNETCTITVPITTSMKAPVYFYYGLSNFYQNHRQYVKSRSDKQLHGDSIGSVSDASTCDPVTSVDGSGNRSSLYVPCGLIARSVFNDTFVLEDPKGATISWTNDGIAWQSDISGLYGANPDTRGTLMDPPVPGCTSLDNCTFQDPDFVVWMRVAALPTFRKLHRIISTDLAPGNYTVTIQNNFPVFQFSGQKKFVISTSSWIGGKNSFLGISYLVVGSFSLFIALVFFILHKLRPRKFGDISLIEWMDAEGPHEMHS